jgi:hypothetical protein
MFFEEVDRGRSPSGHFQLRKRSVHQVQKSYTLSFDNLQTRYPASDVIYCGLSDDDFCITVDAITMIIITSRWRTLTAMPFITMATPAILVQ